MRGDKERNSLERVKDFLFCHKEKQLDLMMSPYYYEINDNDVMENISQYINARRESYHGMNLEDIKEIFQSLLIFKENPQKNNFPDFIFDNGFIEHFQITSSIENKKGAKKEIFSSKFKKEIEPEMKEFEEECRENSTIGYSNSKSWEREDVKHSYDDFQKSMTKNLNKHLKSYEKYIGEKDIGIFLIEYSDCGFMMHKKTIISSGVESYSENGEFYKLSSDREMLKQLYDFKDKIKYVIFEDNTMAEIIKLSSIPDIISNIKEDYVIIPRNNLIIVSNAFVCCGLNVAGGKNE